jgi:prepilin-type N-terminal cleavage/methylation domain-containing protein
MLQKLSGNSKGFTLIELMIVIAIIGILAAIAIPNFIAYRDKAYCSKVESDAQNVLAALASYFSEPDNTSIEGGVGRLEDQEELVLNGANAGSLIEVGGIGGGVFEAQISDGSGRCPRSEDDTKHYFTYMGTTTSGGWYTPN